MASDSISEIKDENEKAVRVLNGDIDGVSNLAASSVSFQLGAEYRSGQQSLENERNMRQAILDDIAKLEEDMQNLENTYPVPQTFQLPQELLIEQGVEVAHIESGAGRFVPNQQAVRAQVVFGEPIPKPPPLPPRSSRSQPKE